MHKLFIKRYFFLLGLIFIFSLPVVPFILKTKEIASIDDIVTKQISQNSIYGTALNGNTFHYKLALVKNKKPDVIAIGSSRTMQIREEFFSTSFISTGGATNHLDQGIEFLQEVIKIKKPKLIIYGLDFWWFNDAFPQSSTYNYQDSTDSFAVHKIVETIKYIASNKINSTQFIDVLLYNNLKNLYTSYNNIGIDALVTSTGFRKDGSYFYSKTILGIERSEDIKFNDTILRIKNGTNRFQYGTKLSEGKLQKLLDFIKICKNNNINLILFIPPISNKAIAEMNKQKEKYQYIEEFREKIKSLGGFDYHDPSIINSNDCEFIDGFHGGDVTYQRIILDISKHNKHLDKLINKDLLQSNISTNNGYALTNFDQNLKQKEIDFLELGCKK